jgi:protein-S-isoprenylcysteine O-methyltransferase Ste14
MLPTIVQVIFVIVLGCAFVYFLGAGQRTFTSSGDDDTGAIWAQISFGFTGALPALLLGGNVPIRVINGIAAVVVLTGSLTLYEWARHTIRERGFYIAWSGNVPDALCDRGPYAYVRHPIYMSYLLAFLALLAALPGVVTLAIFVFNVALFTHAAWSDERSLTAGAFASEYARYKARTGMFLPRLVGAASTPLLPHPCDGPTRRDTHRCPAQP